MAPPAISARQDGGGRVFEFLDGGTAVLFANDGGAVTLGRHMDGSGNAAFGLSDLAGKAGAGLNISPTWNYEAQDARIYTANQALSAWVLRLRILGGVVPAEVDIVNADLDLNNNLLNNTKLGTALNCNLQAMQNFKLESFTTAARPAPGNSGRVIYVSDAASGSKFQGDAGSDWVNLG